MDQFRALVVRHHIGKSEFIKQFYRVEKQVDKIDEEQKAEVEDGNFAAEVEKVDFIAEVEDLDNDVEFASAKDNVSSAKGFDEKKLAPEKASEPSHGEFASAQSKLSQDDCWNLVKVDYVETQSA